MRDKFIEVLLKNAKSNKDLFLLTGDLGFRVFDAFRKLLPEQFVNMGVSEQNMALVASGMSLTSKKVFIYSIGNFSTLRCLEMIRNDITYHNLDVKIVSIGGGFSYGQLGMSHHATEDLSIMKSIPNLSIFVPSSLSEVQFITNHLCNSFGPAYLRLDKDNGYFDNQKLENIKLSHPRTLFYNNVPDIIIFGVGGIMSEVEVVSKRLLDSGYKVQCYSIHSLKPLNLNNLLNDIKNTSLIVTVEENNLIGGFGSFIIEKMIEIGVNVNRRNTLRLGIKDVYAETVGSQDYLRRLFKIDSDSIFKEIVNHINFYQTH